MENIDLILLSYFVCFVAMTVNIIVLTKRIDKVSRLLIKAIDVDLIKKRRNK